ncbi:MAG: D-alanyl-D-alanine carboxypeptidase/D-alanyl-D-alanine-endopeptidase [Calditrichaeota bacterium]|nr:D-alanyl-D-alanine carboxypeptidase/D-alanyl-D-alanine-endopeptidase [Calditrichota bacterium]
MPTLRPVFPLLLFLALLMIGCSASRPPVTTGSPNAVDQLRQQIEQILADIALTQSNVGIKILSLDRGEVLYSRDSHKLFHPASNMKLLTTATALNRLGTSFFYETVAGTDSGMVPGETLGGNLYLQGRGNPDLELADLEMMIAQLRDRGLRRITGDLVVDPSYFDELFWGNGWMWDDASAWYWAPITPLAVNDNCVEILVSPGKNPGDSLIYKLLPDTRYMKVINNGFTAQPGDSAAVDSFTVVRDWIKPANVIRISGAMYPGQDSDNSVIDVLSGDLFGATLFAELLERAGIAFTGAVRYGKMPANAAVWATHRSPLLAATIINTNKISDNLSAENLLKTVAAQKRGVPGTARNGVSEIYAFLDSLGVDSTSYRVVDGSGVSRYDVITPDLLVTLLEGMHRDFRVQAEFKTSLPIAGVDGTLKYRMRNTPAQGNLRAKTGSLSGVSSLSGYTSTADGELLAFSIIMEHFLVPTRRIREAQDRIGALISGWSRQQVTGK